MQMIARMHKTNGDLRSIAKQGRGLLQRKCACGGTPGPTGECEACRKKRMQRKAGNARQETHHEFSAPPIVHEVLRSPGHPLDPETRGFMEPRFGRDFSNVRVHNDAKAADSARAVNALAYTVGKDVVFGQGQYQPANSARRSLLAHELTHVIQQQDAAPALESGLKVSPADGAAERQAEFISRGMLSRGSASPITSCEGTLQRQTGAGAGSRAPAPRKTIWVNVGFDSSAQANDVTMRELRTSIAVEKTAIFLCCVMNRAACDVDVKTHYDWNRVNKPAPSDGDYDSDNAADRTLRDKNLAAISGPSSGRKVLVTESTLSQTWQGARIFPRANTGTAGILWNRNLAADDTLAHESGHAAGYAGDAEGGAHSSNPDNLMAPGSIRHPGAIPDANWCTQMASNAT